MTPSSTRTTGSKQTMVGSKPGFDRCVVSRRSDQHASLPPVTPSSRTSRAATTTSLPTSQPTTGCRRRSMTCARHLTDTRRAQPCRPIRQRNRAASTELIDPYLDPRPWHVAGLVGLRLSATLTTTVTSSFDYSSSRYDLHRPQDRKAGRQDICRYLKEIQIPPDKFVSSLLAFNLGIEGGQIFIVALAFPFIYFFRKKLWYPFAIKIVAGIIAAIAIFWFIQRIVSGFYA